MNEVQELEELKAEVRARRIEDPELKAMLEAIDRHLGSDAIGGRPDLEVRGSEVNGFYFAVGDDCYFLDREGRDVTRYRMPKGEDGRTIVESSATWRDGAKGREYRSRLRG